METMEKNKPIFYKRTLKKMREHQKKGDMKMNKIYIETNKRKFFLSYADISITDKKEILIGFKKSLMPFKYSETEKIYKKIYEYEIENQKPIFEFLKKIYFNDELIYKFEDKIV